MLEIRDLVKVYRPKRGVPVTAIDHISLRLPDTGMIFLLGKSGSGKSTLLNLIGGLDSYDDGDILIRGTSTKAFTQQQFDAYRNAYVGFIFQEYNVLEEFTVGANIGLALELQGQKATDSRIGAILEQLDLTGYGNRRPNELSGGQKQRVAIARALVKEPRIIMADEPTGALDSQTGRQIFDTLKKLSGQRLVIVVSHDREFAEQYADRIIELADGRILSDCTYTAVPDTGKDLAFTGKMVTVAPGYRLTEDDRLAINAYLDKLQSGAVITTASSTAKQAIPTDNTAVMSAVGDLHLVRSKLPLHSAAKIGAGGLKHKKFRLAVTILLSCVAFGLFGLSDTFGSYNHIDACTDSLIDSRVDYATIEKSVYVEDKDDSDYSYYESGYKLTPEDLQKAEEETGVAFKGVYKPHMDLSFSHHLATDNKTEKADRIQAVYFNGFAEFTENELKEHGYNLVAGQLPDSRPDQVAITAFAADSFLKNGYVDKKGQVVPIGSYNELIGKQLWLDNTAYTVTGVVDTHFDTGRYMSINQDEDKLTDAQKIRLYAMMEELAQAKNYSFHTTLFTGKGVVTQKIDTADTVSELRHKYLYIENSEGQIVIDPSYIGTIDDVKTAPIIWLDGQKRTRLGDKELVVSPMTIMGFDSMDLTKPDQIKQLITEWQNQVGALREGSERTFVDGEYQEIPGYKVVGFLDLSHNDTLRSAIITSEAMRNYFTNQDEGIYAMGVGAMPKEAGAIRHLVSFSYQDGPVKYSLKNAVTYELDMIHEILKMLSQVFLWVGLFFALFASLMLANFIGTSIQYKKQEIGILRAIGSRSSDVFRIFFSESFIIAAFNALLSILGVGIITAVINNAIRSQLGLLLTVLHFDIRQVLLLLAVSIGIAALASFFPVWRIASKRPIDAIRNR